MNTSDHSLGSLIHRAVDDGMRSAEEIHKVIAALPLEVLSALPPLEETMKEVHDVQERVLTSIYAAMRAVNARVGDVTRGAARRSDA